MTKRRAAAVLVGLVCAFGLAYAGVWVPLRVVGAVAGLGLSGWLAAELIPVESILDRILDTVLAIVVVTAVLGLMLDATSAGLTRHTFALGWFVIGVCLVALDARGMALRTPLGRVVSPASVRLVVACVLFVAAAAAALLIANAGVNKQDRRPMLTISALSYGGRTARVEVTAVHESGAYELSVLPDARPRPAGTVTALGLGSSESRVEVLRLPAARCFWSIQIASTSKPRLLRSLKLWVGTSSAGLLRSDRSEKPLVGSGGSRLPASCQHIQR